MKEELLTIKNIEKMQGPLGRINGWNWSLQGLATRTSPNAYYSFICHTDHPTSGTMHFYLKRGSRTGLYSVSYLGEIREYVKKSQLRTPDRLRVVIKEIIANETKD